LWQKTGVDLDSADPVLTRRVMDSFERSANPRLRELMTRLVEYLHAFATDVALTEAEWAQAIAFLTRVGQTCDARRQEMILLSDVLGLSMLVVGMDHPSNGEVTESTVLGPFYVEGSPEFSNGDDLSGGAAGVPCRYRGRVSTEDGRSVPGARIEIWHTDADGRYDVQYLDTGRVQGRGHLYTDAEGRYSFLSVLPEPYPIPTDGPVGDLLAATGRSPMRPAHAHFRISAPGCSTLTTQVFRAWDRHLGADAAFGEKDGLVRAFEPSGDGSFSMTYDFVLGRAPGPARPGKGSETCSTPNTGEDERKVQHG
jgi:hydroxyquinol 1,2-dioxygenase